jgi:hypothetical protein
LILTWTGKSSIFRFKEDDQLEDQQKQTSPSVKWYDTHHQFLLLLANWLIAIATIVTVLVTTCYTSRQLDQMRNATDLEWRPYALLNTPDSNLVVFTYLIGGPTDSAMEPRPVEMVSLSSDAYKARKKVALYASKCMLVRNSGRTPLVLKASVLSSLFDYEWSGQYEKSPEKLVRELKENSQIARQDVDVVVMPGDSFLIPRTNLHAERFMTIEKFEKARDIDHQIVVYVYCYLEYADIRGRQYNTFRMDHAICRLGVRSDTTTLQVKTAAVEAYRWDMRTD